MIMSSASSSGSPFSRQNVNHQTWTAAGSHQRHWAPSKQPINGWPTLSNRRPSPKQAAPELPGESRVYRAHTLNRLDLLKKRQREPAALGGHQQAGAHRHQSALGHYPSWANKTPDQFIYSSASIASPREFLRLQASPMGRAAPDQSQHYAASSYAGATHYGMAPAAPPPPPPSESARSGRESALGQLWERFGTLKRKAGRWSSLSSSNKSTSDESSANSRQSRPTTSIFHSSSLRRGSTRKRLAANPSPQEANQPQHNEQLADPNRKLEADQIYAEGMRAIDGNAMRRLLEHEIDVNVMQDGETRVLVDGEETQPEYCRLVATLINWINDELSDQRIIVKDLRDDLYDGQVLCKLIERLHKLKMDIIEVTQNEQTQKYKLRMVLETINRILGLQARWARTQRWSVDGIHSKNVIEIIHLLVTLALHYRAPVRLRPMVSVRVLLVQRHQGQLVSRSHQVQLTERAEVLQELLDHTGERAPSSRDAFDTLIEFAPDKLEVVKSALVKFVNRHLAKVNMSCLANWSAANSMTADSSSLSDINPTLDPNQFSDGLLFVFLIATLEDYFVPLGNLFTSSASNSPHRATADTSIDQILPFIDDNNNNNNNNEDKLPHTSMQTAIEPTSYVNTQPIHKLHNVNVALQLMEEAGLETIKERVRAEDIANGDLRAVLRVLYALFSRYKHL